MARPQASFGGLQAGTMAIKMFPHCDHLLWSAPGMKSRMLPGTKQEMRLGPRTVKFMKCQSLRWHWLATSDLFDIVRCSFSLVLQRHLA